MLLFDFYAKIANQCLFINIKALQILSFDPVVAQEV